MYIKVKRFFKKPASSVRVSRNISQYFIVSKSSPVQVCCNEYCFALELATTPAERQQVCTK
ncbi:MAG: hypothetical protein LBD75_08375 [Candidatus Peribacteria bacterium]|nr:hypothetical protein [Candidatus Peribacteria bacterium]